MSTPYQPYPQGPPDGYEQQPPGYGQSGGYGQPPSPQGGREPGQRTYLQGAPVNFGEAVTEAFKNVFTYSGRASRSAFWWFYLFSVVINIGLRAIPGTAGGVIGGIIGIVLGLTSLAAAARRLHDADHSAFWLFLILLPIIGWIPLLVFYVLPGTPGPNKYDYQG